MQAWERLVDDVTAAGDKRVCISNEDFGRATPEQAEQIVTDLGGDRVHVLAVGRRLDQYLPSQWQQRVTAGSTKTYDAWLRDVLDPESGSWDHHNVWFAHDLDALMTRWTDLVGPARFTLLVSDSRDRDLLPHTFEDLLGLPRDLLELRSELSRQGLSWSQAELVRTLNAASAEQGWSRADHDRLVKSAVVGTLRHLPRPTQADKAPPLPAWALDRVRELSDARVEAVARLGVRVVGDVEQLRVPADIPTGPSEDCPPIPVEYAARALVEVISAALAPDPGDPEVTQPVETHVDATARADGARRSTGLVDRIRARVTDRRS